MKQLIICLLFALSITSCNYKMRSSATKEFIEAGSSYSKAIAITNGNIKTIYTAGLTGDGADFETQTRSTFEQIRIVLEKAGASWKDVVKTNIYIPNYKNENVEIFRKVRKEILGDKNMPASTIIGIEVLAAKDKLIEIEAIATVVINK